MAIVGVGDAVTATFTGGLEVVVAPLESITLAESGTDPAAVGIQLNEYGAVVAVPTSVPLARNSTRAIVAGAVVLAVAVIGTATPTVATDAAAGLVSTTIGATTITLMAGEVATVPFESVTRADNPTMPAAVGVHVKE
jgi:hypothetical protein